jgi:hypothetical protein
LKSFTLYAIIPQVLKLQMEANVDKVILEFKGMGVPTDVGPNQSQIQERARKLAAKNPASYRYEATAFTLWVNTVDQTSFKRIYDWVLEGTGEEPA